LTTSASNPNDSVFGNESSDICEYGSYVMYDNYDLSVYAPGLGNVTCGDVRNSAYNASYFDFETCAVVVGSVNGTCCTDYVPSCYDICGYGAVSYVLMDR
jgi:hypothetical protein